MADAIAEKTGSLSGIAGLKDPDEQNIESELEKIEPSREVLNKIRNSSRTVAEHINNQNPDVIILSGRSADLSKTLIESQGIEKEMVVIPPDVVTSLYNAAALGEEEEGPSLSSFLNVPPESRIVLVDDFVKTGDKAKGLLRGIKMLGYTNVSFATFAGYPDKKYASGIFIAEKDPELANYLSSLASLISVSKKTDVELPNGSHYISHQSEISAKTGDVLSKIRNYISSEIPAREKV